MKKNLIQTIIWDKYFGIDLLSGSLTTEIIAEKKIIPEIKKNIEKTDIDLSNVENLDNLYDIINKFDGCQSLKSQNSKTVIYDGVKTAKIMLIGEAPGEEEETQGVPFCGQSGQLLDKVLATINIERKTNLYITNSVFWRPPANRKPTTAEIEICRPFLEKQIDLIKPNLIILCGATPVSSLIKSKESLGDLRQKIIDYTTLNGTKTQCVAIYHPAFLLRNPIAKKSMWFDMLFIKDLLFAQPNNK